MAITSCRSTDQESWRLFSKVRYRYHMGIPISNHSTPVCLYHFTQQDAKSQDFATHHTLLLWNFCRVETLSLPEFFFIDEGFKRPQPWTFRQMPPTFSSVHRQCANLLSRLCENDYKVHRPENKINTCWSFILHVHSPMVLEAHSQKEPFQYPPPSTHIRLRKPGTYNFSHIWLTTDITPKSQALSNALPWNYR